ncbi:MAG: Xaa-Pro peptidase family protein, partial [Halioglobus sp.]|nr:Xaa-Pro peptidase family protein [Halioglobus sp.]
LGLDYYVCHDPANIFYLTNFANFVHERPFILVVPASGSLSFLMPKLEENHVRVRSVGPMEFVHYFEFPAPAGQMWSDRLREILTGASRVGLESQCPLSVSEAIECEVVITDPVDEVRQVKSPFEINRIAYCARLLSEGHRALLAQAAPGQLPILLHKEASGLMIQQLLGEHPDSNILNTKFNAATQPPALSDDPHNFTDLFSPLVEGGPHVTVVQGMANGYGAEIERTFFLGSVPDAAVRPFNDMLEARALAYDMLRPGADMAAIDAGVNALLKSRGHGAHLLHRTGHSFGVTDHEGPFLAEGYEHEVQADMVFSIEPGIYLPGIGGFRFSDTVLVTGTGNMKLTDGPETLQDLTLAV